MAGNRDMKLCDTELKSIFEEKDKKLRLKEINRELKDLDKQIILLDDKRDKLRKEFYQLIEDAKSN